MKAKYIIILSHGTHVPLLAPAESETTFEDLGRAGQHVNSIGICELRGGDWHVTPAETLTDPRTRREHDTELLRRTFGLARSFPSEWEKWFHELEILWQRQRALDEMGPAARVHEQEAIDREIAQLRESIRPIAPGVPFTTRPARTHRDRR